MKSFRSLLTSLIGFGEAFIHSIYQAFSSYPSWIGQSMVGIIIGGCVAIISKHWGRQILYALFSIAIGITVLCHLKIIIIKGSTLVNLLGVKSLESSDIIEKGKTFFDSHVIEILAGMGMYWFISKSNV